MKTLIVEDDIVLRQLFKKQIEINGHEADAFENAENALEAYKNMFYHLIILDLGLPDMDGLELCRRIRSLPWGKQSLILVVTGRDHLEDVQAALEAGADDYLNKPINRKMLEVRLAVIERQILTLAQRRQREDVLQDDPKLRLFRHLLEHANDAIFIIDPKTAGFLDVNNTACRSLGYSRGDLLNMRVIDIARGFSDLSFWEQYINNVRENKEQLLNDTYIRKNGTTFSVESNMASVTQEGQEYIVAIARDITERK
jgi:PAS domain S-box-containing protein